MKYRIRYRYRPISKSKDTPLAEFIKLMEMTFFSCFCSRFDHWDTGNNHQQSVCFWDEVHHVGGTESNVWTSGNTSEAKSNKVHFYHIFFLFCLFSLELQLHYLMFCNKIVTPLQTFIIKTCVCVCSGCYGGRRHGEHVQRAVRHGQRDTTLRRREDGGPHCQGRPHRRLQQVPHGKCWSKIVSICGFSQHHNTAVCYFHRATVQRTRRSSARSAERSRTPTPSAPTAAAKRRTSPACWPRRSSQSAFHREVQKRPESAALGRT